MFAALGAVILDFPSDSEGSASVTSIVRNDDYFYIAIHDLSNKMLDHFLDVAN
jgi:hypothetical protein